MPRSRGADRHVRLGVLDHVPDVDEHVPSGREGLTHLVGELPGVDRGRGGLGDLLDLLVPLRVEPLDLRHPLRPIRSPVAEGGSEITQERVGVADEAQLHGVVATDLGGIEIDVDELGLGEVVDHPLPPI
jgi:hypothetical protein